MTDSRRLGEKSEEKKKQIEADQRKGDCEKKESAERKIIRRQEYSKVTAQGSTVTCRFRIPRDWVRLCAKCEPVPKDKERFDSECADLFVAIDGH